MGAVIEDLQRGCGYVTNLRRPALEETNVLLVPLLQVPPVHFESRGIVLSGLGA
jgi:hypothetical protein